MPRRSFLLLSLLIAPCLVQAQRAPSVSVPAAPTVHMAPVVAAPAAHVGAVHVVPTTHPGVHMAVPSTHGTGHGSGHPTAPKAPVRVRSGYTNHGNPSGLNGYPMAPGNTDVVDGFGVPGLGFDYVHYAAVHPNLKVRSFGGGSVVPFVGGGIYVPVPYYAENNPGEEQPAEAGQTDASGTEPVQREAEAENTPVATPRVHATGAPAPLKPSTEFTFVRRDGTVFFAVAYSWQAGNLQYVTQDGLRRIVPLNTLDLDATSQFNEQRGVTFRSPS